NGKAPDWEISEIDHTGFTKLAHVTWRIRSHPQETAENSVDIGHFTAVHRYDRVTMIEPVRAEGKTLTLRDGASRRASAFGRRGVFNMEYEVKVLGLGFSIVRAVIPEYGLGEQEIRDRARAGKGRRPGDEVPRLGQAILQRVLQRERGSGAGCQFINLWETRVNPRFPFPPHGHRHNRSGRRRVDSRLVAQRQPQRHTLRKTEPSGRPRAHGRCRD